MYSGSAHGVVERVINVRYDDDDDDNDDYYYDDDDDDDFYILPQCIPWMKKITHDFNTVKLSRC